MYYIISEIKKGNVNINAIHSRNVVFLYANNKTRGEYENVVSM
jgi:hypothetical protein